MNPLTIRSLEIDRQEAAIDLPISIPKLRSWLLDELSTDTPVPSEAVAIRFRGPLDRNALRACLDALVSHHDSLRTGFLLVKDDVVARIRSTLTCPFRAIDLDVGEPVERERAVTDLLRSEAATRFRLSDPPLLRALLIRETASSHVLALVFHPLIADGTSFLKVFPTELAILHEEARTGGDARSLLGNAHHPAAFAAEDRAARLEARTAADLEYWRETLAAPPLSRLPADRPHPPRPSGRTLRVERRLDRDACRRIEDIGKRLGARRIDVLLAGFVALLARYGDETDIIVGVPSADRKKEMVGAVGCFINTFALRMRLDADTSLADLARQSRRRRREARAHGSISSTALRVEFGAGWDLPRHPLYQATFSYLGHSVQDQCKDDLAIDSWRIAAGAPVPDLGLAVARERDGGHVLTLEANADVFDAAPVARMVDHYARLLAAGLENLDGSIWRLPLIGEDERRDIERAAAGPPVPQSAPASFHQFLATRALEFPDRTAARSQTRRLTYRELQAEANTLAHRLVAGGVSTGELVLVGPGEDPCDTLVMILGVLAAGAAYVPLEPAAPPSRLAGAAEDSGARWLVAGPGFPVKWCPAPLRVLLWDQRAIRPEDYRPAPPDLPLDPERPAYLMYTSGSSGTPKGVLVSHRNLVHQTRARLDRYADPPGVLLATYSFAFDSSLAGISWTLASGGELRFVDEALRRDIVRLRELIAREGITHLDMVPSMYAALLAGATPERFARLRVVVCGGETLPIDLAEPPDGPPRAPLQRVRPHRSHGVQHGP
jgi:non-ribosomal peptide synthetase component F